jgi:hypothetical protein
MMDQGKKKGKSREQGKKREISENRKESKKDKTCKNLYPFVLCVLLHILVVLKEKNQDMYQLCSLLHVTIYPQDQETESNVLFALDLPLLHLQSRKKNCEKEKILKTVIISFSICILLYMVHSSGSQSKKKGSKNTKTCTKRIGRNSLVFVGGILYP